MIKVTEGYKFWIEHIDCEKFYIQVTAPDGCFSYDGYWDSPLDATIEDALREALNGSKLLGRAKRTA
jgi:hypothetical protein